MKRVIPIWIILLFIIVFGYMYRAKISFTLSRLKTVRADKEYRGSLKDSMDQHLKSAQCLHKLSGDSLPKETLDELLTPNSFFVPISSTNTYSLGYLNNSAIVLHYDTKIILDEIAKNFAEELKNQNLPKHKLRITSLTRSRQSQKRISGNDLPSAHWYGHTLSISFRYYFKINLTRPDMDGNILKEILEKTLMKMHKEKKIWVTGISEGSYFTITKRCPIE